MEPKKLSRNGILVFLFLLISWQCLFFLNRFKIEQQFRIEGTIGMKEDAWRRYIYFFHYLGWFPAAVNTSAPEVYSVDGAKAYANAHADDLVMDAGFTSGKLGDYGKIFLYYPEVWFRGVKNATIRSFAVLPHIFALTLLFINVWNSGFPVLAVSLVVFLGSNPFQNFHLYTNTGVFSLVITVQLLLLAIHFPFLIGRNSNVRTLYSLAFFSGILLGLSKQIRGEPFISLISVLTAYVIIPRLTWKVRFGLVLALFCSLFLTTTAAQSYFDSKFQSTSRAVKDAGGHPYPGPRSPYHVLWHPIYTGLGDFDTKYGFYVHDFSAFEYANPIVLKHYDGKLSWTPKNFFLDQYYDEAKKYKRSVEDLPEYEPILRSRILSLIAKDPLWYGEILLKRTQRILSNATPITVGLGAWALQLKYSGWLFLSIALILIFQRNFHYLRVILFTLPLVAIPLLIFSVNGTCNYPIHHIVGFAFLLECVVSLVRRWRFQDLQAT